MGLPLPPTPVDAHGHLLTYATLKNKAKMELAYWVPAFIELKKIVLKSVFFPLWNTGARIDVGCWIVWILELVVELDIGVEFGLGLGSTGV